MSSVTAKNNGTGREHGPVPLFRPLIELEILLMPGGPGLKPKTIVCLPNLLVVAFEGPSDPAMGTRSDPLRERAAG